MLSHARRLAKRALFGPLDFRQQCAIGLPDPQPEVEVSLAANGSTIDVTNRHVIASGMPLIVGISLRDRSTTTAKGSGPPLKATLQFRQRDPPGRLLGEIDLQLQDRLDNGLCLFRPVAARNHCAPALHQRQRELASFLETLRHKNPEGRPSVLESRSLAIFYFCPRPIVLVSVSTPSGGNLFPMDLIGPLNENTFALALQNSRAGIPLIETSGRVAISGVPSDQAGTAYSLGANHRKSAIDWDHLGFPLRLSEKWNLPVPAFASRVRELELISCRQVGSYQFFRFAVASDQKYSDKPQLHFVHGFYNCWRPKAC